MKIYLAARFSRIEELKGYMAELEALGHTVTSRWIKEDHRISDEDFAKGDEYIAEKRQRFASEDYNDIHDADCIILFSEEPRSTTSKGGRHVEFGLACAWGHRLIVIGPRENIFHCLPDVIRYATWADFKGDLG